MARNLLDLAKSLESRAKLLPEFGSSFAKHVAMTIVTELAHNTPVDTSQAISNWTVTIGSPSTEFVGPHYPGERGSTYEASSEETILLAKIALLKKKPGQSIFITNNADYIRKLNDGSSPQQPAGFVERAIFVGKRSIAKGK